MALIDSVSAILLISEDAPKLAEFYRSTLNLPLEDEVHEGVPLHYGCEIGAVHFAIHPAEGWPGKARGDSRSPIIALSTVDVSAVAAKLRAASVDAFGPFDHGFADTVSFRDPDGNQIEVLQYKNTVS